MQRQQKVLLNFLVIVFLLFYGIISITTADDLTITHAYSLYSGSESVDFGPNGNYIATGDIDGDVGFWEVEDDEAIDYVNLGGEVQGVTFSPDGRYLAADGIDENHGGVIVWLLDVATRTTVSGTYVHDDAHKINSIAYSPDGRYVAVAVDLTWAYLWDLNSGEREGWGNVGASEVYDVAFSPDGRYLATGNDNGDLTLWELNSWWTDNVNKINLKLGGEVRSVAFTPNGKYLAADSYDGRNTSVTIYDIINNKSVRQIDPDVYEVNALVFSPDGQYLAVGGTDPEIIIYRIGTAEITSVTAITEVATIQTSGEVYDLAWSPDGTLISDGRDVWNVIYQTPNPPDNTDTTQEPDVTVNFSPSAVQSPAIGEQLTLSLNITGGEKVSGYQAIVNFDTTALKHVQSDNGDYLPAGAFFIPPKVVGGKVTLAATSLAGESDGDGTLANITFEIVAVKDSTLTLSDVLLTNSAGQSSQPLVEAAQITESSLLTNGIGLTLPPDLISEVAFGPNSTYFVLTSQFPTLIGVDDADAIYMDCFIKLDLPGVPDTPVDDPDSNDRRLDNPAYFMFPLETARQQLESVKAEAQGNNITTVIISAIGAVAGGVVGSVIPGIGTAAGVISGKAIGSAVGFAVAVVSSVVINQVQAGEKEEAILASTADPVLVLQPFDSKEETGRPSGAFEKLFLIPQRQIKEIRIVVAQVYRLKSEQTIRTPLPFVEDDTHVVTYEGTWNLEDGTFAAPGVLPVSLSDYPPFQQLSPQVQEYFRRHFGEFANVEAWHMPEATFLLPNYPNPFNPETWIPYQLATPADVSISIYTAGGQLVRKLELGHQAVGIYESRSRAAYWDGKNTSGEPVASGVYFYTLTAGDFTATRKMLIRK